MPLGGMFATSSALVTHSTEAAGDTVIVGVGVIFGGGVSSVVREGICVWNAPLIGPFVCRVFKNGVRRLAI